MAFKYLMMYILSANLSPKEKIVSRGLRIMLEDHYYWSFVIERYVVQGAHYVRNFCSARFPTEEAFEKYRLSAVKKLTQQCHNQGMLRTGTGNAQKNGIEDLEALSTFLGNKTYILGGDQPSELDCVLFG